MRSQANEVLYGGAAGGGKSAALLALPLYWIGNPHYRGLYLRRESKYLGDAIDKTRQLYEPLGGVLKLTPRIEWVFPVGGRLWLNHCEHENDIKNYDSFEFNEVLFDELTHFTERQYRGIRARLRTTHKGLPAWSRAGTNPGGDGHDWVFARFAAWLDPTYAKPASSVDIRYYSGDEECERDTPLALSRQFIAARLSDNPHIRVEYEAQLNDLDALRRAQLLDGNWLERAASKNYWDSSKCQVREGIPALHDVVARVRAWDFGATDKGDYTVGARVARLRSGLVVIENIERFRGNPERVRSRFQATAKADLEADPRCSQVIPLDPGQAGIDQLASYQRDYPSIAIKGKRPSASKITRFAPLSARQLAGNIAVVRAEWNSAMHKELEALGESKIDDQVDALSDAYAEVTVSAATMDRPDMPKSKW